MPADSQMKVGACGAASSSAQGDELASMNPGADGYVDLREVHVDAHQPESVVDDDATSFKVKRTCEDHTSIVDGRDRCAGLCMVVEAAVDAGSLSVEDSLAAEGVRHCADTERGEEVGGPLRFCG